ncbi:MAG: HAMP domain-containing histidine kinase [Erysipelotrichia bacterium]|jgi:two-component system sensor histidine kinase CssS|nr:HAMP domain-containing histidine kinase [Erysipelotrichia bacterium]
MFKMFYKKLTLAQQLLGVMLIFITVFSLLFLFILSLNIDAFVRNQMYGIIKRTQNNIIYNYRLSLREELLYGANDPNIIHVIFTHDGNVVTSNNLPLISNQLFGEIKSLALEQTTGTQDYISESDHRKLLFTITRIDQDTAIMTAISNNYRDEFKTSLLNNTVNILVTVTGVLFLLLMAWVATIIRPLNQIRSYVEKRRLGQDVHLNIDRDDEIGDLAKALVAMNVEVKRAYEQKEEMIHNISHDLKTPIATIRSYSESILDGVYPYDTLEKSVEVILQHAQRLESKVKGLLTLNRVDYVSKDPTMMVSIDMKKVVEDAILSMKVIRPEIKIEMNIESHTFFGIEEPWRILCENLIDNALRYAQTKIVIKVKGKTLEVFNDGEPIEAERIHRLFIPYEKGKNGNFGLGLAIVKKIANTFNCTVSAKNHKEGVSFIVKGN